MTKFTFLRLLLLALLIIQCQAARADITSAAFPESPYQLDLNGGVMTGGASALPGLDAQVSARLGASVPLYLGAEVGMFFAAGNPSSATLIPILGTLYTSFAVSQGVGLRLGASVGPVLATGGGTSGTALAVLFDPTLLFALGSQLLVNVQARFGVIGANFVAIPQLGLTFVI